MSATRAVTEFNIRQRIDDLDKDKYAISSLRMNQFIQGHMHHIAGRMVLPYESLTSVSITAGNYDYTLSGTVNDVRQVIWNATGEVLEQDTFDNIVQGYLQDVSSTISRGIPTTYALYETSAQASKIRLAPTPSVNGTLKVYYGIIPTALVADSDVIPFSTPSLRVLEMLVAAECVDVMSPQDRQSRQVDPKISEMWRADANRMLSNENFRMRTLGSLTPKIQEVDC